MIANSRPLHFVPHVGVSMPWQTIQGSEAENGHPTNLRPKAYEQPLSSGETVVVCLTHTTEYGEISPLPLSGLFVPGIVLIADYYTSQELKMSLQTSQQSDTRRPSFAENIFLLLMLG
jgi:hypothetical protein